MKQRLILWLPAGLFVFFLALQLYFTQTSYLNAWRGGGFGMFATTDSSRRLRVLGYDEQNNEYQISFISSRLKKQWVLKDTLNALERLPHPKRLQKFADSLLHYAYVPSGLREKYVLEKSQGNQSSPRVEFNHPEQKQLPYIRLVTPHEKIAENAIQLKKIKLTVWSVQFDLPQHKLSWRQLGPEFHASKS